MQVLHVKYRWLLAVSCVISNQSKDRFLSLLSALIGARLLFTGSGPPLAQRNNIVKESTLGHAVQSSPSHSASHKS